ncbi:hypothetical protein [Streptomyces sp. NBC_00078]|uniref:hypothetical protein n=1 Tax=unclassified Streptomyces TaxID=2593676 RepID=UPI00224D4ED1|nr:hypothetical protein [Streptomyces sp. NBC_00078]MCX5423258.1 hypothetical protein [Streptomyces sp. NBC_00078]
MVVTAETSVRRGRHRRPRPRRVLLAVGGLALAAGALSLVRMAPESGVGAVGTAEADPRQDPGTGTGRSDNAVATVEAVPRVSPSATSAMGGASATPTAASSLVPLLSPTAPPDPESTATTTLPQAPNTPAPTPPPHRPTTTPPTPRPTPTPGSPTPPPPNNADDPDLCVPIIGLCVGPLAG